MNAHRSATPAGRLIMILATFAIPAFCTPVGWAVGYVDAADAAEARTNYEEVVRQFNSVNCEGLSLAACTSPESQALKATIRERIQAGWTKDRIVKEVEDEFGERILAVSPRRGMMWWLWVLPGVIVAAGAALITLLMRRLSSKRAPFESIPKTGPVDQDTLDAVERAVRDDW